MPGDFNRTMRNVKNVADVRRYARQFNEVFAGIAEQRFDETGLYENLITLMSVSPNWCSLISQTPRRSKAQIEQMVARLSIDEQYELRDIVLQVFRVQNVAVLIKRVKESNSRFDLGRILHDHMDVTDFIRSTEGNRHEGLYWILSDLADMMRGLEFILEALPR